MLMKDRALRLALTVAFALSAGLFVVGCSDDDNGDGAGGSGGSATGGTGGGAGGTGGDGIDEPVICGGIECMEGEFCNEVDECACDPENDTCGEGTVCDDFSLRCSAPSGKPSELGECQNVGEISENEIFECVRTNIGPRWLRPCDTSDDCLRGDSICVESTYCFPNTCGRPADGNGSYLDFCDTQTGEYSIGGSVEVGTCLGADNGVGICTLGGSAGIGDVCRQDDARNDPDRVCANGLICRGFQYNPISCSQDDHCAAGQECNTVTGACEMKFCDTDSDCDDTDLLYCNVDGVCELIGFCADICNGGTAEEGAFVSCTDPNGVCPEDDQNRAFAPMFCQSPCDPFGGAEACPPLGEGEDERARVCAPSPTRNNVLNGECRLLAENPVPVGGDCSAPSVGAELLCEPGSTCITITRGGERTSTCLALCDCEAGFRAGECQEQVDTCGEGEVCLFIPGISEVQNPSGPNTPGRIGVCREPLE